MKDLEKNADCTCNSYQTCWYHRKLQNRKLKILVTIFIGVFVIAIIIGVLTGGIIIVIK